MPRFAAIFALGLMFLTGFMIGTFNSIDTPPPAVIPRASPSASRTAVAFYNAIDQLLKTGTMEDLRRIVDPNLVDHSHLSAGPGTVESLETYLLSVREFSPGLRFTVSEVLTQNDIIAVMLKRAGDPASTLAGLSVEQPGASTGYELLRIENDLVTERWASPSLPGMLSTPVKIDNIDAASMVREPRIERLTFGLRAETNVTSHNGTILIAEQGELRLNLDSVITPAAGTGREGDLSGTETQAGQTDALEPGKAMVIAPGTPYRLWNAGDETATLISITLSQMEAAGYYAPNPTGGIDDSGISHQLLAGGTTILPGAHPLQLTAGYAVAAPGTTVSAHDVPATELLYVISGTVQATLHKGFVFSTTDNQSLATENAVAEVQADQAISAGSGTRLSYQVTSAEAATFWLITIRPQV